MGTSSSSSGSPSGVPLVPPWVPDLPSQEEGASDAPSAEGDPKAPSTEEVLEKPHTAVPVAPRGRFASTRLNLGRFAGSGDRQALQRAVGNYVGTGYGGSRTALQRFGNTVRTAGALNSALSQLAANQPQPQLDRALLAGKSARNVIAAIVDSVRPVDGTQDAEAGRAAINKALSEVLTKFPEADLLDLRDDERMHVIECYVSQDVYNQFYLDVGKVLVEKAPSATAALARSTEVLEFIRQAVAAEFRKLVSSGQAIAGSRISQVVQATLQSAFHVFEEYVQ